MQQTTLTGDIEEGILSMYDKGIPAGDIEDHIKEIVGLDVSDSTINRQNTGSDHDGHYEEMDGTQAGQGFDLLIMPAVFAVLLLRPSRRRSRSLLSKMGLLQIFIVLQQPLHLHIFITGRIFL